MPVINLRASLAIHSVQGDAEVASLSCGFALGVADGVGSGDDQRREALFDIFIEGEDDSIRRGGDPFTVGGGTHGERGASAVMRQRCQARERPASCAVQ